MKVEYSKLLPADISAVDDLMKRNSQTLGFLPTEALNDYLHRGGVIGAKSEGDKLIAYLLYAPRQSSFRIVQLCVSRESRGQGIARELLEELKGAATTQSAITLNCRRDFAAHQMWPRLGFVPIGEKPGRSVAQLPLTMWHLTLKPTTQMKMELFKAEASDETIDAIIDAQVFYDLCSPENSESERSNALLSDFLVDSLNLWTTDELLNEIDRNEDSEQRRTHRSRLQQFPHVTHSPQLADDFYGRLKEILPDRTESQISDIRQLAKAAASDVSIFVTRDQPLQGKAREIANLTNLRVLSPTKLIIELHELLDGQSYAPDRVSGLRLGWHRITASEHTSLALDTFVNQGEKQRDLKRNLDRHLERPNDYECELLKSQDEDVSIRITPTRSKEAVNIPLARVAHAADRVLFGRFLIADTIAEAVAKNQDMVKFEMSGLTASLIPDLIDMGFTRHENTFVKFCFSRCLSRGEVLQEIETLSPGLETEYSGVSDTELEKRCAPVNLNAAQNHFLIPIQPGYALSLIDRQLSSSDMFGGDPTVLLRWENVYYRKAATSRKILKAPGRILWYVSHSQKEIVAVSHLDEVVIDTAKELLRKFKKFGILRWEELYEMCAGDMSIELMALRFSHTFVFRKRIPLSQVREAYEEDGRGLNVQSLTSMPASRFQKLFRLGFPDC